MDTNQPQGPFCQSCSMPMPKPEDFGANADGSENREYCSHCFQEGKFTEPDITVTQMVDKCTGIMQQMNLPDTLIDQARTVIPTLRRWRAE